MYIYIIIIKKIVFTNPVPQKSKIVCYIHHFYMIGIHDNGCRITLDVKKTCYIHHIHTIEKTKKTLKKKS